MSYQHKTMAGGRWNTLPLIEQLANVGAEVERGIKWRKENPERSKAALVRALELMDLTVDDPKNKCRPKELMRVRDMMADYFFFDNEYQSTDDFWHKYFFPFACAAALRAQQT